MENKWKNVTIIIPARLASTRLPEKMLSDIAGKPLIQRVWERILSFSFPKEKIVIATDSPKIEKICHSFGAQAILTREDHPSGTSRLFEACEKLLIPDDEIIINVQGDEPLIPIEAITKPIESLKNNSDIEISTIASAIKTVEEYQDPNAVKVLFDHKNRALMFSRSPLPFFRGQSIEPQLAYRHIGVYGYRASSLKKYQLLPSCEWENAEKLEQLKALYHGMFIQVAVIDSPIPGVDTEKEKEQVTAFFTNNNNNKQ